MITVALFWIASNQEESKSLLWKGWINDLYTHAIEHCTAVRLSKPQVQTTVDETHKHDPDWEKLDTNAHTENQAWVKETKQSRHSDSVVWETTYSPLLGAGGKWWGEHEGFAGRLSFHFLIWMPATWVFLSIHAVVHCWQVYNFVFPTGIKS